MQPRRHTRDVTTNRGQSRLLAAPGSWLFEPTCILAHGCHVALSEDIHLTPGRRKAEDHSCQLPQQAPSRPALLPTIMPWPKCDRIIKTPCLGAAQYQVAGASPIDGRTIR